jgi:hypothetical protein
MCAEKNKGAPTEQFLFHFGAGMQAIDCLADFFPTLSQYGERTKRVQETEPLWGIA